MIAYLGFVIVYLGFVIVYLGCDCVCETSRCLGDQALSPGGPTGHRHPSTSLQKLLGDADDDDDVTDDDVMTIMMKPECRFV